MEQTIQEAATAEDFSGVVSITQNANERQDFAFGFAHRSLEVENTPATRFSMASGSKGMTALAVMSLVEDGTLSLETTARSVLGKDLSLIDDAVTIEHLLTHRSGIGDYLDEDDDWDVTDYVMPGSAHALHDIEDYLIWLDGRPQKFAPGTDFSYCNGGFNVLAIIAQRASGIEFQELVQQRVLAPAGMTESGYLRSDELPGDAALGYLPIDGHDRTNVFHLPVRGGGDGGMYTTVADMERFWAAFFADAIVSAESRAAMLDPRSDVPEEGARYGMGFWRAEEGERTWLEGYDAGVSFRSAFDPSTSTTVTVLANTSEGAWPMIESAEELVGWS
ncbi:serine hydrolase domain-containing protein [Humidisolicoccus flavus]|uniref:serine hydrolase domain-containing protein n=1 Tax=Humidisolicoccus flavus TaxID=3111414 RepID=UPI003246F2FC